MRMYPLSSAGLKIQQSGGAGLKNPAQRIAKVLFPVGIGHALSLQEIHA